MTVVAWGPGVSKVVISTWDAINTSFDALGIQHADVPESAQLMLVVNTPPLQPFCPPPPKHHHLLLHDARYLIAGIDFFLHNIIYYIFCGVSLHDFCSSFGFTWCSSALLPHVSGSEHGT